MKAYKDMNEVELNNLIDSALVKARQASSRTLAKKFGEGMMCGFAWVNVKPARVNLLSYLKSVV